jgi:hypothetical protein
MDGGHLEREGGRLGTIVIAEPAGRMPGHGRVQKDERHIRQLFQGTSERLILLLRVLQDNIPREETVRVFVVRRDHTFEFIPIKPSAARV